MSELRQPLYFDIKPGPAEVWFNGLRACLGCGGPPSVSRSMMSANEIRSVGCDRCRVGTAKGWQAVREWNEMNAPPIIVDSPPYDR